MEAQPIKNAKLAKEIIKSRSFRTYSMADRYRELAARTGFDFDATIHLMEYLPVFMDGAEHKRVRQIMATHLASTSGRQVARLEDEMGHIFAAVFAAPRNVELVSELAQPLWRAISSSIWILGRGALDLIDAVPSLFFPTASISDRRKVNEQIEGFIGAADFQERNLILLCLAVLGARPFVGSVALSLYQIVSENSASRSDEIPWPQKIPVSSLNYVDRVCKSDTAMEPFQFGAGDRLRCFTRDRSYTAAENTEGLFGFGAHSCLGRPITETAWRMLVAQLSRIESVLTPINLQMSFHTEPFLMPSTALISVR